MIELDHGIRLKGTSLWLDATRVKDWSFVSHAHQDHVAAHRNIICSPHTARLFRCRMPKARILAHPFHTPFEHEHLKLELHPAGHILGSSQVLIKKDQKRIVYTGDFKLKKNLTAEPAEPIPCDILIMECTYGRPAYVFPNREVVIQQLVQFIEDAIENRLVPVLYAYILGKSQEVAKLLGDLGYTVCLSQPIYEVVKVYQSLGVTFKNFELMEGENFFGKVLLLPPYLARSKMVQRIKHKRTAFLSGWALDPTVRHRLGVDEAIPLSDHADFEELMAYVRAVKPSFVYTLHGFPDFAAHLRKQGFKAKHLEPKMQLTFWED
jgi:Cft2 family RNA processing exonuclease